MSFEKYKETTLGILNMNYNVNLFSSSNREALADKIASAISGTDLPENKVPINPEPEPNQTDKNVDDKKGNDIKQKAKPKYDKKGMIINKSTKKRSRGKGKLSKLKKN